MILYAIVVAAGCLLASRGLIHYFQLESYQFPGYFRTLGRNWKRAWLPGVIIAAAVLIGSFFAQIAGNAVLKTLIVLCCMFIVLGALGHFQLIAVQKAKKPLVFTPRIKRLYGVAAVVYVLACWAMPWLWLFPVFLPLWVALAGLLAWPIEKLISEMYFRDAQRMLKNRPDLIKIGITGSYGKTSVKFILGTMLQEKYQTLITPSSFNTPMGVTKIIRTKLQPAHQVFVAEMGARHVGDIKEMCRLVHPHHGVLTSVGPQHLDTFKTLERIKKT